MGEVLPQGNLERIHVIQPTDKGGDSGTVSDGGAVFVSNR